MNTSPSLNPLLLHQFTRELYSEYDAYVIQQLLPATLEGCYDVKLYKSPDISQEVIADQGYVAHGLTVVPGSLLLGFMFPSLLDSTQVTMQITDVGLTIEERPYKLFPNGPVPWIFLSNTRVGMPNLLNVPHPIIEPGKLLLEFWNVSGAQLRTQIVLVMLEPKRERPS